jgi:DNA-binding NarL/FixJ family response regulator
MTYSVLIVDDHAGMRTRIRELVAEVVPTVVFGEVSTAHDACTLVRGLSWRLALVDLQLPDRSGLAVIHAIVTSRAATHILAMSSFGGEAFESLALRAGAHAFVTKDHLGTRLPTLLRERNDW